MLTISQALHAKILAHARADHPDEACGVIAGPAGTDRPERFIPMANAERSPTFYRFDSMEQLGVWREMDDRDEEPVVIYHHPRARYGGVPLVPHRRRDGDRGGRPRRAGCAAGRSRAGCRGCNGGGCGGGGCGGGRCGGGCGGCGGGRCGGGCGGGMILARLRLGRKEAVGSDRIRQHTLERY